VVIAKLGDGKERGMGMEDYRGKRGVMEGERGWKSILMFCIETTGLVRFCLYPLRHFIVDWYLLDGGKMDGPIHHTC
jgi:hypothetical protein